MDSGCLRHMTGNDKWFSSLTPTRHKEYIIFGDNGKGKVRGVGAVRVFDHFTLREVALVSNLGFNLLSVSQLLDEGFEVRFRSVEVTWFVPEFWFPEETWFAGSFLVTEFSWSISLELLLALLAVWWRILLLIFGNGIGDSVI